MRYLVSKAVTGHHRLERRRAFLATSNGRRYWRVEGDHYKQKPGMFKLSHDQSKEAQCH